MENQPVEISPPPKTKNTQRLYALLSLAAFVILIVAVSLAINHYKNNQASKAPRVAEVRITQAGFEPSTLTVKRGTKVVWTNTDDALHQVAANPYPTGKDLPSLKSEILNNAQTYSYIADKTGSFGYHDQIKPTINGTLVIEK